MSIHLRGIFYKMFGCACFAIVNSIIRYITTDDMCINKNILSFYQIVFWENIIGAMLLFPLILKQGIYIWITKWPILHITRILLAVSGMLLWYASLKFMPITQALALSFTGPILSLLAAKLFLKESINHFRFISIMFSIIGAFLIIKPYAMFLKQDSFNQLFSFNIFIFLPILSAVSFSGTKICDRVLCARGESPKLLTLYLLIFMAPISLIPAMFNWHMPSVKLLLIISIISLLSTIAYLSFAKAFTLASVSFLTPFGFSKLIFSAIVAYIAFDEFSRKYNFWLGVILIFLSVIISSYFDVLKKLK